METQDPPVKKARRRRNKPGTAPGTIVLNGDNLRAPVIRVIAYDAKDIVEAQIRNVADLRAYLDKWAVVWVNVDGLGDAGVLQALGDMFSLHPLALEDVVNTHQRPKVEEYESHLFIVTRMANRVMPRERESTELELEQISIFLGKNYVLSFQERSGDCFDPVRERIRKGTGRRIRFAHTDYLAYALLDAMVDEFFPIMDDYGAALDAIEEEIIERPGKDIMKRLHLTRRHLQQLRHAVWPLREELSFLMGDNEFVDEGTRVFLRDCRDHVIQALDILENNRERTSGLTDLYLSTQNHKLGEVMKVLTIIATIFMPLTFIVGIYGMNFNTEISPYNMPELDWYYGYPLVMAFMGIIGAGMVYYFRKRGWFGGGDETQ